MIVRPASTNPRGPVRRGLRVAGLAAPVLLLLAVVAAGLAGPRPEPPVAETTTPASATPATAPASPPPGRGPAVIPDLPAPAFPAVAAGLAVQHVQDVRDDLAAARGTPVAVAGWLTGLRPPEACPEAAGDTRGVLSPLCERRALLLTADPDPGATAHLHVTVPPGVRLPPALEQPDAAGAAPVPVVVVGRALASPAACGTRGCSERLVADRVTWATGAPFEAGVVFDAGLEVPWASVAYRGRDQAVTLATGMSGTVLVEAAVRPRTVGILDPDAGLALAALPRPDGLVWYVRAIETVYGPARIPAGDVPPRLRWVVLDHETGAALAGGITGEPAATSAERAGAGDAIGELAGLPVLTVTDALAGDAGPVAVTGWLRARADPQACHRPIAGLPGSGCVRDGFLADAAWEPRGDDLGEPRGPHVRARIPAGVAIPDTAVAIEDGAPRPVRVTLIGRLERGGAGGPTLVVERVAWAGGQRVPLGHQVAAGLRVLPWERMAVDTDAAAERAIGPVAALLRVVLVEPRQLRALDPAAARALRATGGLDRPAWYLRALVAGRDESDRAAIRWAVIDRVSGAVLASGDERPPSAG